MSRRLRRKGGFVCGPDIVGLWYGAESVVRLTEVMFRFLFRFPGMFGTRVLCRVTRPFEWACFRFRKFGLRRHGKFVWRTGAWSRQELCSELFRSLYIGGIRIPDLAERGALRSHVWL